MLVALFTAACRVLGVMGIDSAYYYFSLKISALQWFLEEISVTRKLYFIPI